MPAVEVGAQTEDKNIVLVEGDGIGPEIAAATTQILDNAVSIAGNGVRLRWGEALLGQQALDATGEILPEESLQKFIQAKLGLKGPLATVTGEGFRSANFGLRYALDLYANMRPVTLNEGLTAPLRRGDEVNFVIFRENTEDLYLGIEYESGSAKAEALIDFLDIRDKANPDSAVGIKLISPSASKRLVNKAVRYTLEHDLNRITLVHKGNIEKFTEGAFLRWGLEEARLLLGDRFYSEEECEAANWVIPDGKILVQDRIADNMLQDIVLNPDQHQVIATMNEKGDLLSDSAAALIGGLGLAPGINIGDSGAIAEAVHGTAPKLAGKGVANPSAFALSGVLLLKAAELGEAADLAELALRETVKRGFVTADLEKWHSSPNVLNTAAFADKVCDTMTKG